MKGYRREVDRIRRDAETAAAKIAPSSLVLICDDGAFLDDRRIETEELEELQGSPRVLVVRLAGHTHDQAPPAAFIEGRGVIHPKPPLSIEEWAKQAKEKQSEYRRT